MAPSPPLTLVAAKIGWLSKVPEWWVTPLRLGGGLRHLIFKLESQMAFYLPCIKSYDFIQQSPLSIKFYRKGVQVRKVRVDAYRMILWNHSVA